MPGASEGQGGLLEARYANHFQIGHNEFEFVFEFGQFHPRGGGEASDRAVQIVRIVMAPSFAHALLSTLQRAVGEYEQQHGPIDQG